MFMKRFASLLVAVALIAGALPTSALAGSTDPLFVNLTTDEAHRANMALSFSKGQLERGHPLTIFLNDRGVLLGSKANAAKFAEHQKMIAELISKGATVFICAMCSDHYGVKQTDWLPGLKLATEQAGMALFKDDTKTLSW
jgi:sulfur relay (sulfurtransferase) complex TusBCD TusD component (DsrE family)